jgi:putative membrane protein insertion efficiency factor
MKAALRFIVHVPAWIAIGLVRVYQRILSPLLPPMCRYTPSCSQYMIDAIRKRGFVVGVIKGALRILRCNPFFPGGYDPVR